MPGPAPAHVKRFPPPPGSKYAPLYEVWPSLGWGEKEWFFLFEVRDDVFHAILDGIGAVNLSSSMAQQQLRLVRREAEVEAAQKVRARQDVIDVRTREDKLRDERIRANRLQAQAAHRAPRPAPAKEPEGDASPRLTDTLREVANGFGRDEVAEARGRSPKTVKAQLSALMRRYDVATGPGLVSFAFRDLPVHLLPGDLRPFLLKTRQHEVLVGLARGLTLEEVAKRLFVTRDTAKTHSARMYEALDVENARQAVSFGFRAGMLFWRDGRVVGWRCGTVVDP